VTPASPAGPAWLAWLDAMQGYVEEFEGWLPRADPETTPQPPPPPGPDLPTDLVRRATHLLGRLHHLETTAVDHRAALAEQLRAVRATRPFGRTVSGTESRLGSRFDVAG
jgi:hypothetical protein